VASPQKTKPAQGGLVVTTFAAINEFCAPVDELNVVLPPGTVEAVVVTKPGTDRDPVPAVDAAPRQGCCCSPAQAAAKSKSRTACATAS
jgi:hypothetical protein